MNKDELMKLIQEGESLNLELKEAKSNVPRSLWETYSAFANTEGGIIYLGVREKKESLNDKQTYEIIGVENPKTLLKDFWDTINNKNKVSLNTLVDENIQTINVDDVTVIKIDIPIIIIAPIMHKIISLFFILTIPFLFVFTIILIILSYFYSILNIFYLQYKKEIY